MHKLARQLIFFLVFLTSLSASGFALPWQQDTLVTINGSNFTSEDFKHWWEIWKEADTPVPETPDVFIDWHLLAQEARNQELEQSSSYQKKISVFLRARSMMLLKQEEVNSKIDIAEKDIIDRYNKLYSPVWQVEILYFDAENKAAKAQRDIGAGLATFSTFTAKAEEVYKPLHYEKRNIIPIALEQADNWKQVLSGMKAGEIAAPFPDKHYFVLLKLVAVENGGEEDYQHREKSIQADLVKEREAELTGKLVQKLRKKYAVTVDEKLLARINADDFPPALLDAPLIHTNQGNFPAGVLVGQFRREMQLRTRMKPDKKQSEQIKRGLLKGFIDHKIALWESLERHYEKTPALSWQFGFYQNHRLIKELEKRFLAEAALAEDETASFYRDNVALFTRPEKVKIAVLDGDKQDMRAVWLATLKGDDLAEAAKKYGRGNVSVQEVALDALEPGLKSIVHRLTKDEVSRPVAINGKSRIIKLMDRTAASVLPFEQARPMIEKRLQKEKFSTIRNRYLTELKARSTIAVNDLGWEKLKEELRKQDEAE